MGMPFMSNMMPFMQADGMQAVQQAVQQAFSPQQETAETTKKQGQTAVAVAPADVPASPYDVDDQVADHQQQQQQPPTPALPPAQQQQPLPPPPAADSELAQPPAAEPKTDMTAEEKESVMQQLRAMGFSDEDVLQAVAKKNDWNLPDSVHGLTLLSEWDYMLDDLNEMGFPDRDANRMLLLHNKGNIKRVVHELVKQ